MWNDKTEVFSELLLRIPRNVAALPCKGRDGVGSRRPDAPGAGQVRRDADRAALRDPQPAADESGAVFVSVCGCYNFLVLSLV